MVLGGRSARSGSPSARRHCLACSQPSSGPLFIRLVSPEASKIQLQLVLDTGEKRGRGLQGKHYAPLPCTPQPTSFLSPGGQLHALRNESQVR